jgi:hypothetical protein
MKNRIQIKEQMREKVISYVLAGFGLVAGLAWNEAIKELIDYIFPISRNTILAKFIYASVLTLIFILISFYIMKLFRVKKK